MHAWNRTAACVACSRRMSSAQGNRLEALVWGLETHTRDPAKQVKGNCFRGSGVAPLIARHARWHQIGTRNTHVSTNSTCEPTNLSVLSVATPSVDTAAVVTQAVMTPGPATHDKERSRCAVWDAGGHATALCLKISRSLRCCVCQRQPTLRRNRPVRQHGCIGC